MSLLAKLVAKTAEVGQVAVAAKARTMEPPASKKRRKRGGGVEGCTPCAATKTAVKMYNAIWK